MILDKPFDSIDESDLEALVANQVSECKVIEYKRELPGGKDEDKKEFLHDVSSFANAAGGYLIYGIAAKDAIPVEICGLQDVNLDKEIQRLENMLRDSVEPRIPGVTPKSIPLSSGSGPVIIFRIPQSWAQPHVVKLGGHWRFYSRNSMGKYQLDVSEVRGKFLLSETRAERIRAFRAERLGKVISGETPMKLPEAAMTVFHLVPFGAFDPGFNVDIATLERDVDSLFPIGMSSINGWRYNLDGLLTSVTSNTGFCCSYLQIFRNGCIESVDAYSINKLEKREQLTQINGEDYEKNLTTALSIFLSVQKRLGVEMPFFAMVSLLGVSGCVVKPVEMHENLIRKYNHPIDRDTLLLPEVMIGSFEKEPAEVMRPIFDALWNASGWPRSQAYD
jgi:hypothetical protein